MKKKKIIIITGALGQDGLILSKIYINNNFKVIGIVKKLTNNAIKKVQYTDTKFRLIQAMHGIIKLKKKMDIQYYVTGYVSGFINIIINKIDDSPIYLSYSLKRNTYIKKIDNKEIHYLKITIVNCREKFDEGSIPELDELF